MGFSSITSYAYSTEVCQGNTANADDVEAFYSNLSSKRYAVTAKGYSDKNIAIADKSDFINAKNYNVLYWSGHGGSNGNNATLNITHNSSKWFNTFDAADKCKNTYDLKVAIIAACYQFNGNGLRGKWVEITKNSGLKVLAGYHEKAPASTDTKDSDGVFSVIDRWSEISEIDSSQIIEPITIRKAEEIVNSKLNFKAPEIESCEYVYKKTENGTYRLSVKLVSENNQQYYVDAVSGDLETLEIE